MSDKCKVTKALPEIVAYVFGSIHGMIFLAVSIFSMATLTKTPKFKNSDFYLLCTK